MFRKCTLATAAAIALAVAALAPGRAADLPAAYLRPADLDTWRPRTRVVWGPRFYNGVPVSFGYGLCYQTQLLQTPWGPRPRLINQCW
jgi:hypothetical protein